MQLAVVQIKAARVAHKCGLCARGEHDFSGCTECRLSKNHGTLGTGLSQRRVRRIETRGTENREERAGDRHSASYKKREVKIY